MRKRQVFGKTRRQVFVIYFNRKGEGGNRMMSGSVHLPVDWLDGSDLVICLLLTLRSLELSDRQWVLNNNENFRGLYSKSRERMWPQI